MVIAHHLIWTAYGYWLPNDPRGSMSKAIASDILAELGKLHYGRKKVQPSTREIREFRERARDVLKHPVLNFSVPEFATIAGGIAMAIDQHNYTCYACAIMPDHVHILIRKHKHQAEEMLAHLQKFSRLRFCTAGMRTSDHPVWGGPGWKVFLDSPTDIRRAIRYIEANPIKWQLARQTWPFVKPYDGWPLWPRQTSHAIHSRKHQE